VLVVGVLALAVWAERADREQSGYAITVSPATIVLDAPCECVSVHSNIPLGEVNAASVLLEGVAPILVKSDNRGQMVAKFSFTDIAELVEAPSATLTLTCELKDGAQLALPDTVAVK
jgi:hypothetical protein